MDDAFLKSTGEILKYFQVTEAQGLSSTQLVTSRSKYGPNGIFIRSRCRIHANTLPALPEDPPTPIWELILEQFKDQLVLILLGSAALSFVLALFEGGEGWTAFVDPIVVSLLFRDRDFI